MTGQLDVSREEHLGIIALNRPEAINALNYEMVRGIVRTLEQWRDDDGIRAVLFEGRGPRGFCAGGDVRAVRQAVLDGRAEVADEFFAAEYFMNGLIAGFPKPTVALVHGVVMGGGIGIAGHCRYRISLGASRWAMPEAAIGFVVDVGTNAILAKAPAGRALSFLMTGETVSAAEAIALGLLDAVVPAEDREAVLGDIAAAVASQHIDAALVHLLQRRTSGDDLERGVIPGEDPGPKSQLAQGEGWVPASAGMTAGKEGKLGGQVLPSAVGSADPDWSDLEAVVAHLGPERLRRCSPTSLAAIHASHMAARRLPGVRETLAVDLALAQLMCRWPDFAEGVRAVLVDKDNRPRWQPATLAEVRRAEIDAAIANAVAGGGGPA